MTIFNNTHNNSSDIIDHKGNIIYVFHKNDVSTFSMTLYIKTNDSFITFGNKDVFQIELTQLVKAIYMIYI